MLIPAGIEKPCEVGREPDLGNDDRVIGLRGQSLAQHGGRTRG